VNVDASEFKMTNLERGLMIIELLAEHPGGLGTSDISRILDLPKNFVFRATGVLYFKGYLARNEKSKKFSLSHKLLSMGYGVVHQSSLLEIAAPLMRKLRNDVGETVLLSVVEGLEGVVLDSVAGLHPFRFVVEVGSRFPLYASAPGKASLAFMEQEAAGKIIENMSFERLTANTITDPEQFLKGLEIVRSCGYATDRSEGFDGCNCLAAPIFDRSSKVVAAVTVTGPSNRVTCKSIDTVGEKVLAIASAISVELRYYDSAKDSEVIKRA
jgi:IclR family transcriptional regulator, acetate operon repressor